MEDILNQLDVKLDPISGGCEQNQEWHFRIREKKEENGTEDSHSLLLLLPSFLSCLRTRSPFFTTSLSKEFWDCGNSNGKTF